MSEHETVYQQAGSVEENPLRLDRDKAEQIVDALNTDLSAVYVLYHQLKKHHWNVKGPEYRELHLFYDEAAESAEKSADHLAERVQALGGLPISTPADLQSHSPVEPEGEDDYPIRISLRNDLQMYGDIIETVREHIEMAHNLGDHATAELLREQLLHVEEYAHELHHFLEEDSLKDW